MNDSSAGIHKLSSGLAPWGRTCEVTVHLPLQNGPANPRLLSEGLQQAWQLPDGRYPRLEMASPCGFN